MTTLADTKRMAHAMNDILLDEDAQYLADISAAELLRKTVVCARCGVTIKDATVQSIRCRPCAIKHSKEQVKKKAIEAAYNAST